MSRIALFSIVAILVGVFLPSRSERVDAEGTGDKKPAEDKQPAYLLVQLEGKFVGIKATGKRHQSYIFEFQASAQFHGPGQAPTPNKTLVRFELFDGAGGRDLLLKLSADPMKEQKMEQIVEGLPKRPRFHAVFWVKPGKKDGEFNGSEAQLADQLLKLRD